MPPEPHILAFDTSAAHCAAALLSGGAIAALRVDEMARGQAEHLFPMLEDLLEESGLGWGDLSALGVGVGPGNFTGIRIAVSAARGLSLALGIPAVGVSGFRALGRAAEGGNWALIPAPRDMAHVQELRATPAPARLLPLAEALSLTGRVIDARDIDLPARIRAIVEIAAESWENDPPRPAPLYVRAPDARPASDAPAMLS